MSAEDLEENYDLNVENYSLAELEKILQLPQSAGAGAGAGAGVGYDALMVHQRVEQLQDRLVGNDALDADTVTETTRFLRAAAKVVLQVLQRNEQRKDAEFKETQEFHKQFLSVVTESFLPDYTLGGVNVVQNDVNHFIQERKGPAYSQSYPGEFFPGVINPLKRRVSRQFLNMDTRFRENYFSTPSTNFNVTLPLKFSSVVSVQLTSFEMVLSSYCISRQAGNHFFTLKVDYYDECVVVIVPDGNYTDASLVAYLNGFLEKVGGYFSQLLFTVDLSADGTGTARMLVSVREGYVPFHFTLDFQANLDGVSDYATPLPLKLGWLMGFRNGIYVNQVTYLSEGIVDLKGPRYFYLVFNDYNNNVENNFYSAFNSSLLSKNILARISVNVVGSFQVLTQNNLNVVTFPREYFGPVDIQKLTIQLLDEYGRIVQLNNMDYSFCITLQSVYDV